MKIEHIYISPGHNFFGHYGKPPGEHNAKEVESVECVEGKGLVGDRFFGFKEDYKGQATFFAMEVYEDLCDRLGVTDKAPSVFRRNILTRGADLSDLIDREFEVQGVRFAGVCECSPCAWMDQAFAPGAEEALRGRGGLRARILTGGVLRVEP
ncbi:MAG: molybdenum cofactor biosysynthesis protein [Opitutales bacterium]|nr:molybdenum cofactor biosysynthesis protein [Opitutales bacterium]